MAEKNFKTLTLNDDHIELIKHLNVVTMYSPTEEDPEEENVVAIDKNQMFGGSGLIMDISIILGVYDQRLPHSEEEPEGPRFAPETEQRLIEAYKYVSENLYFIEQLIHQHVTEGIKAGTYRARLGDLIWQRVD